MLLWQEQGQGSLGMLLRGEAQTSFKFYKKYRIFDTFPARGKGDFYSFSLSLAYNETQRQGQTLDSSPSRLKNPFSPSNIYSPCNKQTQLSWLLLFAFCFPRVGAVFNKAVYKASLYFLTR